MTGVISTILLLQATTAAAAEEKSGLSVTLDIAALLSAFVWPIVLLIVFLTYREQIPTLVRGLANRLSKFEFAGISFEMAKAREFVPEWSETAGALDLRHKAQAGDVNDSFMGTFRDKLLEDGNWDYAIVDLGSGREWLTSRLYVMSIVFARMKGIKSLVFLNAAGGVPKRFVCWAEPQRVRWALAKRFPWLEQAYADAYSTLLNQGEIVVSNDGRLGTPFNHADPEPGIELIREFLTRVQSTALPPPHEADEWLQVDSTPGTYEHARWLSALELENILGPDCNNSAVSSDQLHSTDVGKQIKKLLSIPANLIPVVTRDRRFEYLVDRTIILEQVAQQLALQTGSD